VKRPTRLTFVGFGLVLILAIFLSIKAYAQDQRISQLRKAYQDCVHEAVASQISAGQVINASAAIELAFRACDTEEQAIRAHVSAAGVSAVDANQTITGFKLSLKQTVRDIQRVARRTFILTKLKSKPKFPTKCRSFHSWEFLRFGIATYSKKENGKKRTAKLATGTMTICVPWSIWLFPPILKMKNGLWPRCSET
jgi:hypothetical protein